MPGENIIDLEGLLKKYIGPNKEIVDIKKERLTAPGENYCSIMLKLDITLKNLKTGKEEVVHAVAKTINTEVSEFFRQAAPLQFKKEIAFYTQIVPALEEFQKEQGVREPLDLFPKLYAARANLHGNDDEVDDESVIILENLKEQGFDNIDRVTGFNFEDAKLVLADLAVFHALPLALKIKKPNVFKAIILKACEKLFSQKFPVTENPPLGPFFEYVKEQNIYQPYLSKVEERWRTLFTGEFSAFHDKPSSEPWASICHCDMWCNNTMQKIHNGKTVKNILLDFQIYVYASPICDLIFFMFSSIQNDVLKEHFEEFLSHYHRHFIRKLQDLGCDTTPFEFSKFCKEIEKDARSEFLHLVLMTVPIQARQGESALDLEEEDMSKAVKADSISHETKEKTALVVYEFGKRRWI